ncbi:MAG: Hsp20/alpha crystallin family protein [Planctomycetales bacterium]
MQPAHECQTAPAEEQDRERREKYRPLADVIERPDELLLLLDLPGVKAGEIDLQFEDGVLTVRGSAASRQPEDVRFLRREYGVGDFHRSFRVNEEIDADAISAEHKDGVLALHVPKLSPKRRKIEVQTG